MNFLIPVKKKKIKRSSWSRGLLKPNRSKKPSNHSIENGHGGEKSGINGMSDHDDKDNNSDMSDDVRSSSGLASFYLIVFALFLSLYIRL